MASTSGAQRSRYPAILPDVLRAAMLEVLADPKARALADLKIRMLEVINGTGSACGLG